MHIGHLHTVSSLKLLTWSPHITKESSIVEYCHIVCVSRCIPKYRVCLSDSSDCPQYECVGRPASCDKNSVEPACDTDGLVHPSLCQLQQAGKTLAYMGHCQVSYSTKESRRQQGSAAFILRNSNRCTKCRPCSCCSFVVFLMHLCGTDLRAKPCPAFSVVKAKTHSIKCSPPLRFNNPLT